MNARASSKMPPNARQRRKNKKKKAAAAELPLRGPASIHDIPDDLVKLILLRLDSSLWLIYAASTCKRWRGIIAADDGGAAFLRLSSALHPPAIAGHYHLAGNVKDFVPSPSPPSIVRSRFSSFDFLPAAKLKASWEVADSHGGLVLLRSPYNLRSPDLVVCDPIARRYQGILHPRQVNWYVISFFVGACLLEGDGGGISMSNFRVLYKKGSLVYLFSTAEDGDWSVLVDTDINDFPIGHKIAGRVDGSLVIELWSGRLVALDNASLEFSQVDLNTTMDPLDRHKYSSFRVVHSSGGGAGMEKRIVRIVHVCGEELEVFRRVNGAWVLEHSIPRLSQATRGLPGYREMTHWSVEAVAAGAGFVVLSTYHGGQRWFFSVDMETLEMEAVLEPTYIGPTCPYTLPWPPLFQACVGRSRKSRRRR